MRWAALLFALFLAGPALAEEIVSARPEAVSVVVYPDRYGGFGRGLFDGLAMVTERRTVELPAGPVTISFRNVAEGIVPQTVAIQGLPDPVREQNFDYRLLSPGSLLRQSVDRVITVVRTNPVTGRQESERARVIATNDGVMLDIAGRLEALDCSALPEKVIFDSLPGGLIDQPTLSLHVVMPKAGRYQLTVSYLATGVSWRANYVATMNPKRHTLDLSAWVTIGNFSATSFANAPVQVLAGRLERNDDTIPRFVAVDPPAVGCWPISSGRQGLPEFDRAAEQIVVTAAFRPAPAPPPPAVRAAGVPVVLEDLGDYKLYSLPEPTTLGAHQVKQLALFDRRDVAYERVFRFDQSSFNGGTRQARPGRPVILLKNDKKSGLGLAIPAGSLALIEPGPLGRKLFVGGDRVSNTAENLPIELVLGEAPDIQAATTVQTRTSRRSRPAEAESIGVLVEFTNAKAEPVVIQLRESTDFTGFRVLEESQKHQLKDGKVEWRVSVPANGQARVSYTLKRD